MHVQNMGLRTLNGSHGVQQRSTNLESLKEGNIGDTVVQNVHLNQVTIQKVIAFHCNYMRSWEYFQQRLSFKIVHPHLNNYF